MMKRIILAYRLIEEAHRVEYWTTVKNWKESLYFEAMTKQAGYIPILIGVSKKEYRQLKKTPGGFIKKYNDFMREQMEQVKTKSSL